MLHYEGVTPRIKIVKIRPVSEPRPYRVYLAFGEQKFHAGEAATPAEALLLAAARWATMGLPK